MSKKIYMKPPLSYYGGKQRLAKTILPLIPKHKLYVEPFFGGGAIFFAKEPSEAEVINDLNDNLITFYEVLKYDFDNLANMIDDTFSSEALYKEAKNIYKNPTKYSDLEVAWSVWVQCNMSFATKILGGFAFSKSDKEPIKIFNKKTYFDTFKDRLKKTTIMSRDALDIIKRFDKEDAFFYIDPPYFNSECGHYKGYTEDAFQNLLEQLQSIKGKFLLSSYPSEILSEYIDKNKWYTHQKEHSIAVTHNTKKKKIEHFTANYILEDSLT